MYNDIFQSSVTFSVSFYHPCRERLYWYPTGKLNCEHCENTRCKNSPVVHDCALMNKFYEELKQVLANSTTGRYMGIKISGQYVLDSKLANKLFTPNIVPDDGIMVGAMLSTNPGFVPEIKTFVREFVEKHREKVK